jgi:hypothetical protein
MCETLEVLRHPLQEIMDEEFVVCQVTANTRLELIFIMWHKHMYASCLSVYCCLVLGSLLFPKENGKFFVKSFSCFPLSLVFMLQYLSVNAVSQCLLFSDWISLLGSLTGMLLVASLQSGSCA